MNLFTEHKLTLAKEIQVIYKTNNKDVPSTTITRSNDLAQYARTVYPVDVNHRECMLCIYLDRKNKTLGHSIISIGGVSDTLVDAKIVFQSALLANASSLILVHNHPSGSTLPSKSDDAVTTKIKEGAKVLDLCLLDHLILTDTDFYSYADSSTL